MTGDFLIPDRKIYSNPLKLKGYYSCWGVKATGPSRSAVLSGTIGSRTHATKELEAWRGHTKKLRFELVQLRPGQGYTESIQWSNFHPPMLIRRIHGRQGIRGIRADEREC